MRGGYREGAGRKPGFAAKNAEEARRLFSERVATEIGPICDALIKKAKSGDIRAVKELLDRAWGRPAQSLVLEPETFKLEIINYKSLTNHELEKIVAGKSTT